MSRGAGPGAVAGSAGRAHAQPHGAVDMNPRTAEGDYKDAIFFSPHKLPGVRVCCGGGRCALVMLHRSRARPLTPPSQDSLVCLCPMHAFCKRVAQAGQERAVYSL